MATSIFTFIELYRRIVRSTAHVLRKGEAHASATGVTPDAMLNWRLIEDMQPLRFQVGVVCNFYKQWPARVVGLPAPGNIPDDLDLAGLYAALTESEGFLDTLKPEQFEGREDLPLTVALGNGMEPTLPAGRWLTVFATTNLYFHLSTAYDILRSRGVQIGKIDLFSDGL